MFGVSYHSALGDIAFEDLDHWEAMLFGKVVVSLVMGRDGHDGAATIGAKDIVADINRNLFAVDRVDGGDAKVNAGLFFFERGTGKVAL